MRILASAPFAIALALAGCASYSYDAPAAPAKVTDGTLVGPNSMTLYVFDKDPAGSGKSACNGPCATNWPPLAADAYAKGSGEFSVITRDDGARQWAYKGKPLYYWAKDQKPGDRSGDNFNNVWHVARP